MRFGERESCYHRKPSLRAAKSVHLIEPWLTKPILTVNYTKPARLCALSSNQHRIQLSLLTKAARSCVSTPKPKLSSATIAMN